MTLNPSTLAIVGGVLSLVFTVLLIHGTRSAAIKPPLPNVSIAPESVRLFALPNTFIPLLFGILPLGFSEAMVTTPLGVSLCTGMGIFFALRGWAYARSREMKAAGPYIGTYVAFAAAGCYVVAAIAGSVI
jgi:hypothetical protein